DAAGIRRGHRTVLLEGRLQTRNGIDGHAVADIFVGIDNALALALLHDDGRDLILEAAGFARGFGFVLRGDGKLVLLFAGDLPFARDVLGRDAHVIAVEGIPQAVLDHRIDEADIAHLGARTQVSGMRRLAHGLLSARHDDFSIAVEDLLVAERDRAKTRTAKLVHDPGGRLNRNAGIDGSLTRRILSLCG